MVTIMNTSLKMADFLNWLWLSLLLIAFNGVINSWFDKSQSFISDSEIVVAFVVVVVSEDDNDADGADADADGADSDAADDESMIIKG